MILDIVLGKNNHLYAVETHIELSKKTVLTIEAKWKTLASTDPNLGLPMLPSLTERMYTEEEVASAINMARNEPDMSGNSIIDSLNPIPKQVAMEKEVYITDDRYGPQERLVFLNWIW